MDPLKQNASGQGITEKTEISVSPTFLALPM